MSTLIGGKLVGGGFVYQSTRQDPIGGSSPWFSAYGQRIPIRQCRLEQKWIERPLMIAGLLGCPTSRRISFGARFSFEIWFDQDDPIEVATADAFGFGGHPSFRERDNFQLLFFAGYNQLTATYYRAYYSPLSVADIVSPIWDEQSDPRKVIGLEVQGHTKGYVFILPDDGSPTNTSDIVGAYRSYFFGS